MTSEDLREGKEAAPEAVVRYLRACYDAENHATSITHLFHSSVRYLQFVGSPELLLTGERQRVVVGRWDARAAAREAALYPREKALLYTAFPLIGRAPKGPQKRRPICAPLLMYPASLIEDETAAFLEVDLSRQTINLPVLTELVAAMAGVELDTETVLKEFPQAPFDPLAIERIVEILERRIPHLDALTLNWFPRLKDAEFVRAVAKRPHARRPICLAACAVGLFPKAMETRGVLFELSQLAESSCWSTPLRLLFTSAGEPELVGHSTRESQASSGGCKSTEVEHGKVRGRHATGVQSQSVDQQGATEKSWTGMRADQPVGTERSKPGPAEQAAALRNASLTRLRTTLPRFLTASHRADEPSVTLIGRTVPFLLSEVQQQVLESAARQPLTLVIGPPGTGKSCTIAAIAVDHLERGESVLIAGRKPQAVDLVASKIIELAGPMPNLLRGGDPHQLRRLKQSLEQLLNRPEDRPADGHLGASFLAVDADLSTRVNVFQRATLAAFFLGNKKRARCSPEARSRASIQKLTLQLKQLDRTRQQLESDLGQQLSEEAEWARGWPSGQGDRYRQQGWQSLRHWWLSGRVHLRSPVWQRLYEYQQLLSQRKQVCRKLIQARLTTQLELVRHTYREDLLCFLSSLRTRSSKRQGEFMARVRREALFAAFPIWLTTSDDASLWVPFQAELFDVVIFDEATQCDLATSLPLLQRGRRAVIVGDPQQLRHVSFLSDQRIEQLAHQCDLNASQSDQWHYRSRSLLDLARDQADQPAAIHVLDEHFRSLPQIIAYSNQYAYDNRLRIMRQNPLTEKRQAVLGRWVAAAHRESGVNAVEGGALIEELVRQIELRRDLPDQACQTFGVLSPFRDQVDWLTEQIMQRISTAAWDRHRLRVGTAHAFQGEERDLMFLSLAIAPPYHPATLRFLESPELLNVSLTRARHQQYVFYSVKPGELPSSSRIRHYLEWITTATGLITVGHEEDGVGRVQRDDGVSAGAGAQAEEILASELRRGSGAGEGEIVTVHQQDAATSDDRDPFLEEVAMQQLATIAIPFWKRSSKCCDKPVIARGGTTSWQESRWRSWSSVRTRC